MEEANDNIPSKGATASECPKNLPSKKPTEEKRELYSNVSVKKLKPSKLSLKIDTPKSPEFSDLIKPLEALNLFESTSSRASDLLETTKRPEQSVRSKFSEPAVKSKDSYPSVRPKFSDPSVRSKVSDPSVRSKVSDPSVRSKLSDPSVRRKFSDPSVRSKISDSPEGSKFSEPSVGPKFSKMLFKSKIFKPFLKNKLTISETSESRETFELSNPTEKFRLTESLVESEMFEPSAKSKLSDPTEELKITKSRFSKRFASKIFKPFKKNKLPISQSGESFNLSETAEKITMLESPVKLKLSESEVKTKMFESPQKLKLLESSEVPSKSPEKLKLLESIEVPSKDTACSAETRQSQKHESSKTLEHRLESRRSHMIAIYKDIIKVKNFIDEVDKFKPPYRKKFVKNVEMLYPSDASDWANLHAYWDSFRNHITELIEVMQDKYMDLKKPISLTIEEFQDLVELLIYVFIDMRELCEICQNGLDKYRRLCFHYNEYLFLVYASTFNSLVLSLREKMRIELNEFKIIEEEVLGLK